MRKKLNPMFLASVTSLITELNPTKVPASRQFFSLTSHALVKPIFKKYPNIKIKML